MDIKPERDSRYRVNRSELIWIIEERFSQSGTHIFEIHDSIERTVYSMEGKLGEYVVFENKYRKLHPKSECEQLIEKAKEEKVLLFSNWLGVHQDNLDSLKSACFINISE